MNFTYDVTENPQKEENKKEENKKEENKKEENKREENKKEENKKEENKKEENKKEENKTKKDLEKEINDKIKKYKSSECISIDFGMRNLMTIYNPSGQQYIIKGNYLVSINNYYNNLIDNCKSTLAKLEENNINKLSNNDLQKITENCYKIIKDNVLQLLFNENIKEKGIKVCLGEIKEYINEKRYKLEIKRKEKINYYFNKIVKYLWLNYGDKKAVICGYNLGWKTGIKLGNKTNRNFYNIPFSKLLNKLKEKFNEKLIMTEESYTSKCDALSLEEIKQKEKYKGSREKRGLYSSSIGKYINADLNGAINIMRKKLNLKEIKGEGLYNPIVVKIITPQRINLSCEVEKPTGKGHMGDQ
jgi:IS605 OrfB family transposase